MGVGVFVDPIPFQSFLRLNVVNMHFLPPSGREPSKLDGTAPPIRTYPEIMRIRPSTDEFGDYGDSNIHSSTAMQKKLSEDIIKHSCSSV